MSKRVTVFGGTGFLGRQVVERLLVHRWSVRVAVRHPRRARPPSGHQAAFEAVKADVQDIRSTEGAVAGTQAVVNCVGHYLERGSATFEAVHATGAHNVASTARQARVQRLAQISGIGANIGSRSEFIRSRAEGERLVRKAFPQATILRPSVMFGRGDVFETLANISRFTPVLPLFGRGETRLQPVYVGDVAAAMARALEDDGAAGNVYEIAGPRVYRYRQLVELILSRHDRKRLLLPVPFAIWNFVAKAGTLMLQNPPVTSAQVELMRGDNVAAETALKLRDLGVTPMPLEDWLQHKPESQRSS